MQYETEQPFRGDFDQVLELATTTLTGHGFRLGHRDNILIEFLGPGMQSTRQPPILGATRIVLQKTPEALRLDADLGGVAFMQRFLTFFPPGLGLSLLIVFYFVFPPPVFLVAAIAAVAATAPWAFIAPMMSRWIKGRTITALADFLHNIASAAGR